MTDDVYAIPEERSEPPVGWIDASIAATEDGYELVLADDVAVRIDDVVVTQQTMPSIDGAEPETLRHFGLVVSGVSYAEGADRSLDTVLASEGQLPVRGVKRMKVRVLRTHPKTSFMPQAGSHVWRARDNERRIAMHTEDRSKRWMPLGLDLSGEPLEADFAYADGTKGGHFSISGVSGVATKTTYALYLLYRMFETEDGRNNLLRHEGARALVFNVKGEDLMYIDHANAALRNMPDAEREGHDEGWRKLGMDSAGGFKRVTFHAPPSHGAAGSAVVPDTGRTDSAVGTFGFTPHEFVRDGMLVNLIEAGVNTDGTQVSIVTERVTAQLMRHAWPLQVRQNGPEEGSIVVFDDDGGAPMDPEAAREQFGNRTACLARGGTVIKNLADLVAYVAEQVEGKDGSGTGDPRWIGSATAGTVGAFTRRLYAVRARVGDLVRCGMGGSKHLDVARPGIKVIDLHRLHTDAQKFVVSVLTARVFKQNLQLKDDRPPCFVVLDEMNKYAPKSGEGPLAKQMVEIAERGRSLGVLMIGAQQSAARVDPALTENPSIKVVGRLDAQAVDSYGFLTPELKRRITRAAPGEMIVHTPTVPEPMPVTLPFPPYATNPAESQGSQPATMSDGLAQDGSNTRNGDNGQDTSSSMLRDFTSFDDLDDDRADDGSFSEEADTDEQSLFSV